MNYEKIIAKIEENYTTILDRKETTKRIIERAASHNQELALKIIELVKTLDYQSITNEIKEKAIADIKKRYPNEP